MTRERRPERRPAEWNFLSFPTLFGFALGAFIGVIFAPIGPLAFYVAMFMVSFGMAHIITHWFRRRTLDKRRQEDEEAERERRALAARAASARESEAHSARRRRRRR
jgi:hypothetical protein